MTRKTISDVADRPVAVTFECQALWAQSIYLAGSFNGWSTTATPMIKDGSGLWQATIKLKPGRYEFKLLIDGRWCCAPGCCDRPETHCPECVPNVFGSMNRVIEVNGAGRVQSCPIPRFGHADASSD